MFYKKDFKIYLTGEYTKLIKKFPSIKKMVSLPEYNGSFSKSKNLAMQLVIIILEIRVVVVSFSMYKKKSLILGVEESNQFINKVKIF